MADPIPPLPVSLIVAGVFAGLDWLARRGNAYAGTEVDWPEAVRVRRGAVDGERPYRAAAPEDALPAVPAGVPASVSAPALLFGGLTFLWSLAVVLNFGDLFKALDGRRALGFTLTSLAWCAVRAAAGWAAVGFASFRAPRGFAVAAGVVAAMDATLALLPVPCSDVRADDVSMAKAGLAVTAALALGFAVALWRRRGTVARDAWRAMN